MKYKRVLASGDPVESVDQRLFQKAIEVVENNMSIPYLVSSRWLKKWE